jgi:hypothetical protein
VKQVPLRAVLVGATVFTIVGCGAAPVAEPVFPAAPAAASAAAPAATVPAPPPVVPALAPSTPVGLTVPAIGVRTGPLPGLGIDGTGALEVPSDPATAGWFTLGPTPGSRGPAVITGHAGHAGAPGVFHRLSELAPGDEVTVARADGTEAVFSTYRIEQHPKSAFPTERVYGDTDRPELRLITCGGTFDTSSGQYHDNMVVYARLVRVA